MNYPSINQRLDIENEKVWMKLGKLMIIMDVVVVMENNDPITVAVAVVVDHKFVTSSWYYYYDFHLHPNQCSFFN